MLRALTFAVIFFHLLLSQAATNFYSVKGIIRSIDPEGLTVAHEPVPHYMPAMTMRFHVLDTNALSTLHSNDLITFRLAVTDQESWIDQIRRTSTASPAPSASSSSNRPANPASRLVLTNEFGTPVYLDDLKNQAIGLTFFFTRCPIPEYCPRLSKNFAEATQILKASTGSPTNWHLFSVTFDPQNDTPEILREYGRRYAYDSNHWSFLTGSKEAIESVTRMFGLRYTAEGPLFNHDFRTIIIDARGKVQMIYPVGGNLGKNIAEQITKAASPVAPTGAPSPSR